MKKDKKRAKAVKRWYEMHGCGIGTCKRCHLIVTYDVYWPNNKRIPGPDFTADIVCTCNYLGHRKYL